MRVCGAVELLAVSAASAIPQDLELRRELALAAAQANVKKEDH